GAIEACIEKAHRFGHDLKDSVMASDGFLPKIDNIEAVAKESVSAIVQPGGSVEDRELVKECDQHGIAMVMTRERAFRHFYEKVPCLCLGMSKLRLRWLVTNSNFLHLV